MKKFFMAIMFLFLGFFFVLSSTLYAGGCKEHIELHSAAYVANEYGKSEWWVVNNVKINLWSRTTPQGKGKVVGKMYPGSRALIIQEGSEDYKVKSSFDKSIGWVNEVQVERTVFQDTETREPCEMKYEWTENYFGTEKPYKLNKDMKNEEDTYFRKIAHVHPDYQEIVSDPKFNEFMNNLPEEERKISNAIVDGGSAEEVNALLSTYKQSIKREAREKNL